MEDSPGAGFHSQPTRSKFWRAGAGVGLVVLAFTVVMFLGTPASATPQSDTNADMDLVCELSGTSPAADPGYHKRTYYANTDGGTYDIILGDDATDTGSDIIYFGMKAQFAKLKININTAGTNNVGSLRWEFSKGEGAWQQFSPVSDSTNSFRANGVGVVTLPSLPLWAKWHLENPCLDAGVDYYMIRAITQEAYAVQPLADRVSAVEFNLRVKVVDELGNPLPALQKSAFSLTDGSANTVFDMRNLGDGKYELALDMGGSDHNFQLWVTPPGFLKSDPLATGDMTTSLSDKSNAPLVSKYPIKIIVKDSTGKDLVGASVAIAGNAPARAPDGSNTAYFSVGGGALTVSKDGFYSFDSNTDTKAKSVLAGTSQPTVVTLSGTAPCTGAQQVNPGATETCRGLFVHTGSSSSSSTSSSSHSSSGTTTSSSHSVKPTGSSSASSSGPSSPLEVRKRVEAKLMGSGPSYSAHVEAVEHNSHVLLTFDAQGDQDNPLESVEIVVAEGGSDMRVEVERTDTLKPEWGLTAPQGHVFQFVSIRIYIGDQLLHESADFTTIDFRVANEKIHGAGIDPNDIHVSHWSGEGWTALPTDPRGEEGTDQRFTAAGPGHGYFAIASDGATPKGAFDINWAWVFAGVILLNLVIGGALYAFRRHAKPDSEFDGAGPLHP